MIKQKKDKIYGKGIYATRDIEKNTIIYKEKIKFMIEKENKMWFEEILFFELNNNYEKFLSLVPDKLDKYCFSDIIFKKDYSFLNINNSKLKNFLILCYNKIIRNAFNVFYNNINYVTILYNGRNFNHSCIPNVSFKLIIENNILFMIFFTNTYITKNSQLFDNYFNINLSLHQRLNISKTFYGFTCNCSKCLLII